MIKFFGSRRATMFLLPIVIGFIVGLTIFLFVFSDEMSKKSSAFVGEKQLILMSSYEWSKQHLLFVDLTAKRSSELAVLGLAENGGFANESICGSFLGYNLYNNGSSSCFPVRLDSAFGIFLNDFLNDYFSLYKKAFLTRDNYQTSLLQEGTSLVVVGAARDFLVLPIFKDFPMGLSENFLRGRSRVVDTVVIHYTAGSSVQGAVSVFSDPNSKVSAHYVVSKDGFVKQVVDEKDTAWHAGACDHTSCVVGSELMNSRSVGIEVVNLGFACGELKGGVCPSGCVRAVKTCWSDKSVKNYLDTNYVKAKCFVNKPLCWEPYSSVQYTAIVKLVADIVRRNPGIIVDRDHIVGHEEIKYAKSDPGPLFDLDKLVLDVKAELQSPSPVYALTVSQSEISGGVVADVGAQYVEGAEVSDVDFKSSGVNGLGFYKVNPSFRVSLKYNLSDYDIIKVRASEIISSCSAAVDFEVCVEKKLDSFNGKGWLWSLDCDKGSKRVFNDFVDFVAECKQSIDDNCLCRFDSYDDLEFKKFGLSGDYELLFSDEIVSGVLGGVPENNTLFKMVKPNVLSEVLKNVSLNYFSDGSFVGFDSVSYSFSAASNNGVSLKFSSELSDIRSKEWDDVLKILLLKNSSKLSFIRDEGDWEKFSDLDDCDTQRKVFRVCASNENSKFISFDKVRDDLVSVPVTYKFGLFFEDKTAPVKVSGFVVSDTKNAEGLVTLSWLANSDLDVKEYRIYFNTSSFSGISGAFKVPAIVSHNFGVDVYNINLTVPKDNIPYFFAVTAVDKNNNEDGVVNSVSGVSVDDLAPGPVNNFKILKVADAADKLLLRWDKPVSNTDDSSIRESGAELSYIVFMKEGSSIQKLNLVPLISGVKDTSYLVSGLDPVKTYYFVVIAVDEVNNPSQDFLNSLDLLAHPRGFVQLSSVFAE